MRTALLLIVLLIAVLTFGLIDPRNSVFANPQGYVADGSKFGVRVGDSIDTGAAKLLSLRGMKHVRSTRGGICIFRRYGPETRVELFADDSWRNGVVCLAGADGRVREIVWQYSIVSAFP